MQKLQGKNVLITGSSKGIGAAIAKGLASHGANLALHCHSNPHLAEDLAKSLPGSSHRVFQCDLADSTTIESFFSDVLKTMGSIDILVNNAGIFQVIDPKTTDFKSFQTAWDTTMAVNLTSPAALSVLAAKHMAEQKGGRIIAISSRGAFRGEPNALAYGASKAGLNALSQSLAQAFADKGVYVYVIAPGFVETAMARPHLQGEAGNAIKEQSPLHRVAFASEIADTACFLATDAPPFMTGAILDVNGASYLRS